MGSKLPTAAKKLVEDAERIHAEMYPKKQDEKPADDAVVDEKAQKPDDTSPEQPSFNVESASMEAEQAKTPSPEPEKDWQHMYRTIKGKYDAEIPRLQSQVRDMQITMAAMQEQKEKAEETRQEPERLLTDTEIEEYGPDLVDIIRRAARETYQADIEQLRAENERLQQQFGTVKSNVQAGETRAFQSRLDAAVPNWRVINKSQDFINWLQEVDIFSGNTRHDLLLKAYNNGDEARTAAFFKAYQSENAAVASAPSSQASSPQVSLDKLVSPGAGNASPVSAQVGDDTRIIRQAEISKFYADVVAGKYRGREKEKARKEREFNRAANSGRVR